MALGKLTFDSSVSLNLMSLGAGELHLVHPGHVKILCVVTHPVVDLIIPALNEEASISLVLNDLPKWPFRVIRCSALKHLTMTDEMQNKNARVS